MAAGDPQPDSFRRFATGGLERLGVDFDEEMLAVMAMADAIYGEALRALLAADLDAVEPEPRADLSRAPADRTPW
jgi:hypothetical protein